MTTYDNAPPPPDWRPEPRPCVLDDCVCTNAQESIWLHGTDEHIVRGSAIPSGAQD